MRARSALLASATPQPRPPALPRPAGARVFGYQPPSGQRYHEGILHFFGTKGGTAAYENPQKTGAVTVRASSTSYSTTWSYNDHRVVQHQPDGQNNFAENKPNSWVMVVLKAKAVVTHYCLRHGLAVVGPAFPGALRSWELQGSTDGADWRTLRSHANDQSLPDAAYSTAGWAVDGGQGPFSHFRILQTGKTSNSQNYLVCAGIELYGKLLAPVS
jgi:hypothetical protein